jgi:hypothetical protein
LNRVFDYGEQVIELFICDGKRGSNIDGVAKRTQIYPALSCGVAYPPTLIAKVSGVAEVHGAHETNGTRSLYTG